MPPPENEEARFPFENAGLHVWQDCGRSVAAEGERASEKLCHHSHEKTNRRPSPVSPSLSPLRNLPRIRQHQPGGRRSLFQARRRDGCTTAGCQGLAGNVSGPSKHHQPMKSRRNRRRMTRSVIIEENAKRPQQRRSEAETSRVLQLLATLPDNSARVERGGIE